jgi:hypothetical protein
MAVCCMTLIIMTLERRRDVVDGTSAFIDIGIVALTKHCIFISSHFFSTECIYFYNSIQSQ